jgi:hypothetical protein
MTSVAMLSLGASSTSANRDAIDWQPIEANVRRLQMRIAKAGHSGHRVRLWVLERLEPCDGKLSCTVLRGGSDRKVIPLPDVNGNVGLSVKYRPGTGWASSTTCCRL